LERKDRKSGLPEGPFPSHSAAAPAQDDNGQPEHDVQPHDAQRIRDIVSHEAVKQGKEDDGKPRPLKLVQQKKAEAQAAESDLEHGQNRTASGICSQGKKSVRIESGLDK
jgi:hypothetical protein